MPPKLSNEIIIKLPMNINYYKREYESISDFCQNLIALKDNIFVVNEYLFNQINAFVGTIGNYERNTGNLNELNKNIKDIYEDPRYTIITDIILNLTPKITTNLYSYKNNYYLQKKNKLTGSLITYYQKILKTNIFMTGNLSTSIILNMTYSYNIGDQIKIKEVIVKVYPINLAKIYNKNSPIYPIAKFEQISKYIFIREAMIGCWVNNQLLIKKIGFNNDLPITGTIMSVSDAYFINGISLDEVEQKKSYGLPFSYLDFKITMEHDKIFNSIAPKLNKRWLLNSTDNQFLYENNISLNQYGFIEMEEVQYTLQDLLDKNMFDINMFFEIIYTKLCLFFIGNVDCVDDHANNIMLITTNKIRRYTIKIRNAEYKFIIKNFLQIKYIDLERFDKCPNRNIFPKDSAFIDYFNAYSNHFDKIYDKKIAQKIVNLLKNNFPLNNLCEILSMYLPETLTSPISESDEINCEDYYLNLDTIDAVISENTLFKLEPASYRKVPFKIWNKTLQFGPLYQRPVIVVGGGKQTYKFVNLQL